MPGPNRHTKLPTPTWAYKTGQAELTTALNKGINTEMPPKSKINTEIPPKPKINTHMPAPLYNSILLHCRNYNDCDLVDNSENTVMNVRFPVLLHCNTDVSLAFLAVWLSVELKIDLPSQ